MSRTHDKTRAGHFRVFVLTIKFTGVGPRVETSIHEQSDSSPGGTVSWNAARLTELKRSVEELSQDISQGKLPTSLLKDFKLSVDQLRLTLWAIMSFESQIRQGGAPRLTEKLFEFRVKRLIQMLTDLQSDLTGGTLSPTVADIGSLTTSLHDTLQTLARFKLTEA